MRHALIALLLLFAPFAAPASAQPPAAGARVQGRVVVDGALTPERISDASVLAQVLPTWAIPANAPESDRRRLRNMTSRMRLGQADAWLLQQELSRAYPLLAAALAQLRGAPHAQAARQRMEALKTLCTLTYERMLNVFSAEGAAKLRAHVAYLKTRTKVVIADRPSEAR